MVDMLSTSNGVDHAVDAQLRFNKDVAALDAALLVAFETFKRFPHSPVLVTSAVTGPYS
jgi:hypothetical protein